MEYIIHCQVSTHIFFTLFFSVSLLVARHRLLPELLREPPGVLRHVRPLPARTVQRLLLHLLLLLRRLLRQEEVEHVGRSVVLVGNSSSSSGSSRASRSVNGKTLVLVVCLGKRSEN